MNRQNKAIAAKTESKPTNPPKKAANRKLPVIKQTLTSLYRIAKANPLLLVNFHNNKSNTDFGLSKIKLPKSVLNPVLRTFSSNKPTNQKSINKPTDQKSKPSAKTRTKETSQKKAVVNAPSTSKETGSRRAPQSSTSKPKRRSLSSEHYERKRKLSQEFNQFTEVQHNSQSALNITKKASVNKPVTGAIPEE